MSRVAPHSTAYRQPATSRRTRTVCVVDPQPADYRSWESLAQAGGVELCFAADAGAALRMARTQSIDLWVINTKLPGLSGTELCGMLRQRTRRTTVVLVTDDTNPHEERKAWVASPALVFSKPAHESWLEEWLWLNSTPQAYRTGRTHQTTSSDVKTN